MSYRKHLMPSDISPSELYEAVELSTNLAEVGTDCISRQAAIDALEGEITVTGRANAEAVRGYVRLVADRLKRLPPAQPERTPMQELLDVTADRDYWKAQCNSYETTINRLTESIQHEIIRCKDCKYARLTNDGSCKYCDIWFPDEAEYMDGDYYCASAERKSNG